MKIRKLIGVIVFGFIAANVVLAEQTSSTPNSTICSSVGCVNH